MNVEDLALRLRRLDQLSRGLAKELVLWQKCHDPLLRQERLDYLGGIQAAYSGIEAARVIMAKAYRRLSGG
jgi:hypothetical protein